ncbi:DUF1906 domain-containing protein [Actinomadura sp. 21ATH]|uniref:DUF1906 domain-containing protein n=1 Tax=Actinomadura sp. 21ATH TaxID=1735444 RepID=UPI0035C0DC92
MALAPLLAAPEPSAPRSQGDPPAALKAAATAAGGPAAGTRVLAYRGVRFPVPEGWAVHRLDQDPNRCVRYDRRAIYVGAPGPRPDCPARVVGGADVLRIEPAAGTAAAPGRAGPRAGAAARLARFTVKPATDHRTRVAVPEAGVRIIGAYGPDPSDIEDLIRSMQIDAGWSRDDPDRDEPDMDKDGKDPKDSGDRPDDRPEPQPSASPPPSPAPEKPRPEPAGEPAGPPAGGGEKAWAIGKGFDACTAPSISAMRAWRRAFSVSNMYIGGASRGCAQPNLNRKWVRAVRKMGYRLIPTYVGLQAPCSRYRTHFTAKNAAREGRKAAADAVRKARALGVPERKPIYFDMEAYDSRKKSCRKAVLTFLENWSRATASLGYVPAVYSSVTSAIRDLVRATDVVQPDAIWFAHWDGKESLYDHPAIPDHRWHPHRRIKQYRGGHKETHGGVTINIDSNNVDGRVY